MKEWETEQRSTPFSQLNLRILVEAHIFLTPHWLEPHHVTTTHKRSLGNVVFEKQGTLWKKSLLPRRERRYSLSHTITLPDKFPDVACFGFVAERTGWDIYIKCKHKISPITLKLMTVCTFCYVHTCRPLFSCNMELICMSKCVARKVLGMRNQ